MSSRGPSFRRVRALAYKEWLDAKGNRVLWMLSLVVPASMALTGLSMTISAVIGARGVEIAAGDLPSVLPDGLALLDPARAMIATVNDQVLLFQLLNPVVVPMAIASFSIVGEKRIKSLEALFASPLTTTELLSTKLVTAAIPGVVGTTVAYLVCLAGIALLCDGEIAALALRPTWLVAYFWLSPCVCLASALFALAAGSRINDPRLIQALGSVFLMPLFGAALAAYYGWVPLSLTTLVLSALVMTAFCALGLWGTVALFDRERVLTRWR